MNVVSRAKILLQSVYCLLSNKGIYFYSCVGFYSAQALKPQMATIIVVPVCSDRNLSPGSAIKLATECATWPGTF